MTEPKHIITIAGHDPSGGAGLTADIQVLQAAGFYPLSVCTAVTVQTDSKFYAVNWVDDDKIIDQVQVLLDTYPVCAVKIGIIPSLSILERIIEVIRDRNRDIFVLWDPVVKASAGFELLGSENSFSRLRVMPDMITPNTQEAEWLFRTTGISEIEMTNQLPVVVIKSAKVTQQLTADLLLHHGNRTWIETSAGGADRHGTGCLYASVLTAAVASGTGIAAACLKAQQAVVHYRITGERSLQMVFIQKENADHVTA